VSAESDVRVVRHATAEAFLERAWSWLMRDEVENNVILGLAAAMAQGALAAKEPPYLATAVAGGDVVACGVRTPPYKLVVTRGAAEAIAALAADAAAAYPDLPGVGGPEPAAGAFARAFAACRGTAVRAGKRERIHAVLAVDMPPRPAPGALRAARETELDLLVAWAAGFLREANPLEPSDPAEVVRRAFGYGGLFVWDDGGPVSMAAFGGKTPNGIRVNLVYTPPALRSRGYATAAVATLTRRLLEDGNRYCCLYTDLANPISNRIYHGIGYRPVCDVGEYWLGGEPAAGGPVR
jgi:hypothetical protein